MNEQPKMGVGSLVANLRQSASSTRRADAKPLHEASVQSEPAFNPSQRSIRASVQPKPAFSPSQRSAQASVQPKREAFTEELPPWILLLEER